MTATMTTMEWRVVDILNADQLEIGDNINVGDIIVEITGIEETASSYIIEYIDDFGDLMETEIFDDETVEIYMIFDED